MLELDALETRYDDFTFGPLDLTVEDEVLAVLGPSGSGKTTLLSTVAGIVSSAGGSVRLDGRELTGRPPEARGTGVVFQDGALFPHMTARENLSYAATDAGRVGELANLLEIDDVLGRRPGALSGGERQRVALARTLAADPDALLLDEPLSSLDAPIRRRLRLELHDLFGSLDIPVVCVTHDQRTASALGDRLAVLRDGQLEQAGPCSAVLERPATPFVARFTGSENVLTARVLERTVEAVLLGLAPGRPLAALDGTRVTADVGETVTVSVHPARFEFGRETTAELHGVAPLQGCVQRLVNEGDQYRLVVETRPGGDSSTAGLALAVTAAPTTVSRLGLAAGEQVSLSVDPADVNVIG
ncbi:ABC transporter ATP-binding protein [Haloarchaeobius iranensis]|uniref:Molybdate/tungstate import ATP-binding protein WtpC n=1 Tax=Haloarchaeobius iranensis TaxID=996166 RepID=A0A1G9ZLF9_9EURY|nr:ABC transporter ATP-binding protein [Haloarchaeobius iranensis]SDN21935.1 molybdate/tungstate transport system ATP-binding protein [Haloarchaeobius iranensis]